MQVERFVGEDGSLEEHEERRGAARDGADRATEEKRAARGTEREMGRKDTILTVCEVSLVKGREEEEMTEFAVE